MTPEQRIEEAHGLWELAVQRVCAMVEAIGQVEHAALTTREFEPSDLVTKLIEASKAERKAYENWETVSYTELADQ